LEAEGYDVFSLAKASAGDIATLTASDTSAAQGWIEYARLATLRGIGTQHLQLLHRVGITSVRALAAQDPHDLIAALEREHNDDIADARVRVWIRGAKRAIERGLRATS
jgi:predicted flap endonuclease-1-like 5' DNA nuclease